MASRFSTRRRGIRVSNRGTRCIRPANYYFLSAPTSPPPPTTARNVLIRFVRSPSTADRINLSCVACVSRVFIKWPPFRPPICMTLLKRERKRKIQIDRIIRGHDLPASQLLSAPIMRFRHGDVTGRRKKGAPERKDKVGGWTNKTRGKRNKRRNEKKKGESAPAI